MKKALAILMVLAAVTGVAVADVADIAVSGFGKLSWGVNLDDAKPNGFNNETEWDIKIPLLSKKTFTTKSEGDAYAEISIVDAQYNINGDEEDDGEFTGGDRKIDKVSAKLVFGAISVSVYDKPGFKVNNAEIWAPIKEDGYFDDDVEGKVNRFEPGFDGFGTKIMYTAEKFTAAVKLGSQYTWSRAAAVAPVAGTKTYVFTEMKVAVTEAVAITTGYINLVTLAPWAAGDGAIAIGDTVGVPTTTGAVAAVAAEGRKSQYAIGFDGSVTPSDMVTAAASFNYASWAATTAVSGTPAEAVDGFMSAGAKVTVKPIADLEVMAAIDAGNDYMNTGAVKPADVEQVWAYDALLSAKYKFVEAGAYYGTVGTPFVAIDKDNYFVNNLAAYGKVTDGGMVPNLTASATVIVSSLLADADSTALQADWGFSKPDTLTAPLALGVTAAYKYAMGDVNYLKPGFEFFAQNMAKGLAAEGTDWVSAGNVYVEYGLFTNTTVTAKYEAGATQDNLKLALIEVPSRTTKGTFTLACKVTY